MPASRSTAQPGLTSEQRLAFLRDGFVVVQPQLPADVHNRLYAAATRLYERIGDPPQPGWHLELAGDHLPARMADIERVLDDPAVTAALTDLLGDGYLLHPHHFVHRANAGDQGFHQDGNLPWNERGHGRVHRPEWAMLFYYPQAVHAGNGPTEVVPGSQYWGIDHERPDGSWFPGDPLDRSWEVGVVRSAAEASRVDAGLDAMIDSLAIPGVRRRFVHVPAGSVVLAHYDLLHRGSRRLPQAKPRFMFKFYFQRTRWPAAAAHTGVPLAAVPTPLRAVVATLDAWHCGRWPPPRAPAAGSLDGDNEQLRLQAAYGLGTAAANGDACAAAVLVDGLAHDRERSGAVPHTGWRWPGRGGRPR